MYIWLSTQLQIQDCVVGQTFYCFIFQEPFWIVEFPNEDDARRLTSRSVSLRSCIELYSHSKSILDLHKDLKSYPVEVMAPYLGEETSFKIDVETFCRHFSQKEKVDKLEVGSNKYNL